MVHRSPVKRNMPTEMMKEFIGQNYMISLMNDLSSVQGTILAVEGNGIEAEEMKKVRMINVDMIRDTAMTK